MLSKKTKYAIKALSFMVRNQDLIPLQSGLIAKEENISHKFLESIMLQLKKAGYVGSKRGKGGGYYFKKEPHEIRMSDIFRLLEGPIAMVPCVSLNFYEKCEDCPDEKTCSVHNLMLELRDSMLLILKGKTLKDIV
jgi:Rrf2 family protein